MVDERIGLVQGDDLPFIRLQFTDGQTGAALNLSDPEVIVSVRFRAHRQADPVRCQVRKDRIARDVPDLT